MKDTIRDFWIGPAVVALVTLAGLGAFAVHQWVDFNESFPRLVVGGTAFLLLYNLFSVLYLVALNALIPSRAGEYDMEHPQVSLWKHCIVVRMLGTAFLNRIFPGFCRAVFYRVLGTRMGKGVVVAETAVILDPVCTTLEDDVILGQNSVLSAHTMTPGRFFLRPIVVRRGATVGIGAVVMPGADIGEGAVVAPGAVVTMNTCVPAGEFWGGIPARCIRQRSEAAPESSVAEEGQALPELTGIPMPTAAGGR